MFLTFYNEEMWNNHPKKDFEIITVNVELKDYIDLDLNQDNHIINWQNLFIRFEKLLV